METPIYDYLRNYAASGTVRCHMPGHKGRSCAEELSSAFSLDITEISGADSLFEAEGIIAESEKYMSRLYHTAETVYSAGGSTLCIQAMLALMKQDGRQVIAVRNVHRAFLNACALLDISPLWIMPEYSGGILSGTVDTSAVESALKECGKPACLYITSPDYTGRTADIRSLAAVCRRYRAKLLVDNAHGAHLAFLPKNIHPMNLGADLCCDSAHKMLPALTGGAMLHTSCKEYVGRLKQAMSFFGSTSPSYLVMASLDLCNRYICDCIADDIADGMRSVQKLKSHFSDRLIFAESEPFHITIMAAECGYDGNELAERLRANGAECEYSDSSLLILLMSPMSRTEDYAKLTEALDTALRSARKHEPTKESFCIALPEKAMSIREAAFSPCEEITVEEAEGRICASVKVPCPPAIPIAASGEVIDRSCIDLFRRYNIDKVLVVRE